MMNRLQWLVLLNIDYSEASYLRSMLQRLELTVKIIQQPVSEELTEHAFHSVILLQKSINNFNFSLTPPGGVEQIIS
ncbi:hypothetical protein WN943_004487 [Citrus x changshan-huyou]